jgi:2-oxoisovalerate ferredoxin oxidoreductase beta subunit
VALFDAKQRVKARKAIRKAVALQAENRGFAFVEVLSECPIHLHMTPAEAERWVKESMTPVFPLGVKKDVTADPWFTLRPPSFDPETVRRVVGGTSEAPHRYCSTFPSRFRGHDVVLKLAGAGGDGAQTAAMLVARAAINEGFDATHIPSYGPESRGGTSYADVRIAEDEVLSPSAPFPDILVAFNAPSLAKFGPTVVRGGTVDHRRRPRGRTRRLPRGRALHADRRGSRYGSGEEHRRPGCAPSRDRSLYGGDLPGRHPSGPEGEVRPRASQRGGFPPGNGGGTGVGVRPAVSQP